MGHLHLAINHFPVVGLFFAAGLLAYGILKNSDEIKLAAFGGFVIIALLGVVAFFTGESAEEMVEHMPGITEAVIHKHEVAGTLVLVCMGLLAALSLAGLLYYRKNKALHAGLTRGVMALAVIAAILAGRTANLGGQVRHTEIRPITAGGPGAAGETGPETPEEDEGEGDGMPEPVNK